MKLFHQYFVYIIECSDKSYYTGITNNLEGRLWEHNSGFDKESYTYERRPVKLRYCEVFQDVKQSIQREKQIKGWSRKKKEALFEEDWEGLKRLAKSSSEKTRPIDPSTSSG